MQHARSEQFDAGVQCLLELTDEIQDGRGLIRQQGLIHRQEAARSTPVGLPFRYVGFCLLQVAFQRGDFIAAPLQLSLHGLSLLNVGLLFCDQPLGLSDEGGEGELLACNSRLASYRLISSTIPGPC